MQIYQILLQTFSFAFQYMKDLVLYNSIRTRMTIIKFFFMTNLQLALPWMERDATLVSLVAFLLQKHGTQNFCIFAHLHGLSIGIVTYFQGWCVRSLILI